jgi:hypothetical protein
MAIHEMAKGKPGKVAHLREALPPVDVDTVECLERLLSEARAGRVVGRAFVALMPRRNFIVHTTGSVHQEPVYTRGVLRELDDMIRDQRNERRGERKD